MAHPHGTFAWSDVTLPDTDAGAAFYTGIFGWETDEVPAPDSMPYTFFKKDGKVVAGMGPLTAEQQAQGQQPVWTSYIAVDDVDPIAARAAELGATVVMPPMDIMNEGRMTFMFDPTGAAIGFWQAGRHVGAEAFNDPGFMTWNELATRNVPAAVDFYTRLLGWRTDTRRLDGDFEYTMFLLGDRPNGGALDMSALAPAEIPPHWMVYFSVADPDAVAARAKDLGGTIFREPMDTPFGRVAAIGDPQGAAFMVIELPPDR